MKEDRIGEHHAPSAKLSNQPAANPHEPTQPVLGHRPFSLLSGKGSLIPLCITLQFAEPSESPTLCRQQRQIAFGFRTGRKSHPVLYLF